MTGHEGGAQQPAWDGSTIWTVGHSTRTGEELVGVLAAYGIELLADVRRFAGSRRLPQFGAAALERTLAAAGIAYLPIPALGGRRRPDSASPNTGWRHPAFRAYADHVTSDEFAGGLAELLDASAGVRTAIMCAELLWWRCHRRLIADVLTSLGIEVVHIRDATHASIHTLAAPARMRNGILVYDAPLDRARSTDVNAPSGTGAAQAALTRHAR